MMKTEETERQGHLRRWLNVVFILGLLIGFYLFIVPFLLIWANGNRTCLDGVTGGPAWLGNCWAGINHSFFIIQSKSEVYGSYIGSVIEIAGA